MAPCLHAALALGSSGLEAEMRGLDDGTGTLQGPGCQTCTVLDGVHWCGWLSALVGTLDVAKRQ